MADFKRKTKSDNGILNSLTGARYVHIDGSVTTLVSVLTTGCRLIRVVLNTNGATLDLKSGSRYIARIPNDAPEGDFDYGIYCEDGISYVAGGAGSWTLIFDV